MPRISIFPTPLPFIADLDSLNHDGGRQIDWPSVAAGRIDANTGKKQIPAGTIMAELTTTGGGGVVGRIVPRADITGGLVGTSTCILETNAREDDTIGSGFLVGTGIGALSGYGCIIGGVLYSNLLPDAAAGGFATWQGELNTAGVSTGFAWKSYADTRS